MANSNDKEYDLDDFNFDEEDDFDIDSMMDASPIDERAPVSSRLTAGAHAFVNEFNYNEQPNLAKAFLKASLPNEVSKTVDTIEDIHAGLEDIAKTNSKSFKTSINYIVSAAKNFIPAGSKTNVLLDQVLNWAKPELEDQGFDEAAQRNLQIQSAVNATLGEAISRMDNNQQLSTAINVHTSKATQQIAAESLASIKRIDDFSHNFQSSFYRRSLELQYKHLYVAKDQLRMSKANAAAQMRLLDAIVQNTSIPDLLKMHTSEAIIHAAKMQVGSELTASVFNADNDTIAGRATTRMRSISNDAVAKLGSMAGMTSIVDKDTAASLSVHEMAASTAADQLKHIGSDTLMRKLSETKHGRKVIKEAGRFNMDPAEYLRSKEKEGSPLANKVLSTLGGFLEENITSASFSVGEQSLKTAVGMDKLFHNSVTRAIPTLLSEILASVRTIETGDKQSAKMYNYKTGRLEARDQTKKRFTDSIEQKLDEKTYAHQSYLQETIGSKLKEEQMQKFMSRIAEFSFQGKSFDPSRLDKNGFYDGMDPKDKAAIKKAMRRSTKSLSGAKEVRQTQDMFNAMRGIKFALPDSTGFIEDAINDGTISELVDSGLVDFDADTGRHTMNKEEYTGIVSSHLAEGNLNRASRRAKSANIVDGISTKTMDKKYDDHLSRVSKKSKSDVSKNSSLKGKHNFAARQRKLAKWEIVANELRDIDTSIEKDVVNDAFVTRVFRSFIKAKALTDELAETKEGRIVTKEYETLKDNIGRKLVDGNKVAIGLTDERSLERAYTEDPTIAKLTDELRHREQQSAMVSSADDDSENRAKILKIQRELERQKSSLKTSLLESKIERIRNNVISDLPDEYKTEGHSVYSMAIELQRFLTRKADFTVFGWQRAAVDMRKRMTGAEAKELKKEVDEQEDIILPSTTAGAKLNFRTEIIDREKKQTALSTVTKFQTEAESSIDFKDKTANIIQNDARLNEQEKRIKLKRLGEAETSAAAEGYLNSIVTAMGANRLIPNSYLQEFASGLTMKAKNLGMFIEYYIALASQTVHSIEKVYLDKYPGMTRSEIAREKYRKALALYSDADFEFHTALQSDKRFKSIIPDTIVFKAFKSIITVQVHKIFRDTVKKYEEEIMDRFVKEVKDIDEDAILHDQKGMDDISVGGDDALEVDLSQPENIAKVKKAMDIDYVDVDIKNDEELRRVILEEDYSSIGYMEVDGKLIREEDYVPPEEDPDSNEGSTRNRRSGNDDLSEDGRGPFPRRYGDDSIDITSLDGVYRDEMSGLDIASIDGDLSAFEGIEYDKVDILRETLSEIRGIHDHLLSGYDDGLDIVREETPIKSFANIVQRLNEKSDEIIDELRFGIEQQTDILVNAIVGGDDYESDVRRPIGFNTPGRDEIVFRHGSRSEDPLVSGGISRTGGDGSSETFSINPLGNASDSTINNGIADPVGYNGSFYANSESNISQELLDEKPKSSNPFLSKKEFGDEFRRRNNTRKSGHTEREITAGIDRAFEKYMSKIQDIENGDTDEQKRLMSEMANSLRSIQDGTEVLKKDAEEGMVEREDIREERRKKTWLERFRTRNSPDNEVVEKSPSKALGAIKRGATGVMGFAGLLMKKLFSTKIGKAVGIYALYEGIKQLTKDDGLLFGLKETINKKFREFLDKAFGAQSGGYIYDKLGELGTYINTNMESIVDRMVDNGLALGMWAGKTTIQFIQDLVPKLGTALADQFKETMTEGNLASKAVAVGIAGYIGYKLVKPLASLIRGSHGMYKGIQAFFKGNDTERAVERLNDSNNKNSRVMQRKLDNIVRAIRGEQTMDELDLDRDEKDKRKKEKRKAKDRKAKRKQAKTRLNKRSKFGRIRNLFSSKVDGVRDAVQHRADTTKDAVKTRVDAAKSVVKTKVDDVKDAVQHRVDTTKDKAKDAVKTRVDAAKSVVKTKVDDVKDAVQHRVDTTKDKAKDAVKTRVDAAKSVVKTKVDDVKDAVQQRVDTTKDVVKTKVDSALDVGRKEVSKKTTVAKDNLKTFVSDQREKIDTIKKDANEKLTRRTHDIKVRAVHKANELSSKVETTARTKMSEIKEQAKNVSRDAKASLDHKVEQAKASTRIKAGELSSKVSGLKTTNDSLFSKVASKTSGFISDARDKAGSVIDKSRDLINNYSKKGLESLSKSRPGLVSGFKSYVGKAADYGSRAASYGAKLGSKALMVAKKVPGVGLVLGAGSAAYNVIQGNYKAAAYDLAAGVVSLVPVVGTAGAIAIEAARMYDESNDHENHDKKMEETLDVETKVIKDAKKLASLDPSNTPTASEALSEVASMSKSVDEGVTKTTAAETAVIQAFSTDAKDIAKSALDQEHKQKMGAQELIDKSNKSLVDGYNKSIQEVTKASLAVSTVGMTDITGNLLTLTNKTGELSKVSENDGDPYKAVSYVGDIDEMKTNVIKGMTPFQVPKGVTEAIDKIDTSFKAKRTSSGETSQIDITRFRPDVASLKPVTPPVFGASKKAYDLPYKPVMKSGIDSYVGVDDNAQTETTPEGEAKTPPLDKSVGIIGLNKNSPYYQGKFMETDNAKARMGSMVKMQQLDDDHSEGEKMTFAMKEQQLKENMPWLHSQLGKPYKWGIAVNENSFKMGYPGYDCSALSSSFYGRMGIGLNKFGTGVKHRTAASQLDSGLYKIFKDIKQAKAGDLIWFDSGNYKAYKRKVSATHVAIYVGDGWMVHARGKKHGIVLTPVWTGSYRKTFVGFGRFKGFSQTDNLTALGTLPQGTESFVDPDIESTEGVVGEAVSKAKSKWLEISGKIKELGISEYAAQKWASLKKDSITVLKGRKEDRQKMAEKHKETVFTPDYYDNFYKKTGKKSASLADKLGADNKYRGNIEATPEIPKPEPKVPPEASLPKEKITEKPISIQKDKEIKPLEPTVEVKVEPKIDVHVPKMDLSHIDKIHTSNGKMVERLVENLDRSNKEQLVLFRQMIDVLKENGATKAELQRAQTYDPRNNNIDNQLRDLTRTSM